MFIETKFVPLAEYLDPQTIFVLLRDNPQLSLEVFISNFDMPFGSEPDKAGYYQLEGEQMSKVARDQIDASEGILAVVTHDALQETGELNDFKDSILGILIGVPIKKLHQP